MKLITFATYEEASETLTSCNAKKLTPSLYSSDIGRIVITGIGPFATFATLLELQNEYETIINIGLAGALRKDLELGTIYSVANTNKHLWHPKGPESKAIFPALSLQNNGLKLVTTDFPVYDTSIFDGQYDLVDMEGYAAAFSAKTLGKKCQLFKLVSDYCTAETSSQIAKNIGSYSALIASFLKNKYTPGVP